MENEPHRPRSGNEANWKVWPGWNVILTILIALIICAKFISNGGYYVIPIALPLFFIVLFSRSINWFLVYIREKEFLKAIIESILSLIYCTMTIFVILCIYNFFHAGHYAPITGCRSNLKNIGIALAMYRTDNCGYYPTSLDKLTPKYLKTVPSCSEAHSSTYAYIYSSTHKQYTVYCKGKYHEKYVGENFPQYSSRYRLIQSKECLNYQLK